MKISLSFILFLFFVIFCNGILLAQDSAVANISTIKSTKKNKPHTNYFNPGAVIIPGTFLLYGCLKPAVHSIKNLDDKIMDNIRKNHPTFKTNAADYIMWAPSASIYLMDALHVQTRHSFTEHLILDAGSLIVTGGIGLVMRKISGNISDYNYQGTKFPSGHTANAFRGAEIFHQELKDSHQLLSYGGYIVAAGVGVIRIYNKDHFLTEVLAGAGLGMLSTKLTYWVFDKVKFKNRQNTSYQALR